MLEYLRNGDDNRLPAHEKFKWFTITPTQRPRAASRHPNNPNISNDIGASASSALPSAPTDSAPSPVVNGAPGLNSPNDPAVVTPGPLAPDALPTSTASSLIPAFHHNDSSAAPSSDSVRPLHPGANELLAVTGVNNNPIASTPTLPSEENDDDEVAVSTYTAYLQILS